MKTASRTETLDTLRSEVRALLEGEPSLRKQSSTAQEGTSYPRALWQLLAEAGLLALAFEDPREGGPVGLDAACAVLEELARLRLSSPYLTTAVLSGMAIHRFGTEPQRRELLPRIASGELIVSYAGVGAGVMDDPGGPTAREGAHGALILSGRCLFVPFARAAAKYLVAVQLEGGQEPRERALVLVDARDPKVTIEPVETVDDDAYCTVSFDEVSVAPEQRLDSETSSETSATSLIFQWGAAGRCAEMVGGSDRVLEISLDYAKRREQFGRPIGSFQAIQHRCADMAVDALSSRLVTAEAVERLRRGEDAAKEVSAAKAWVCDAYARICASGHQLHGAIGYTRGHTMHRFFRHSRSASLDFGDAAYHRELLARQLEI